MKKIYTYALLIIVLKLAVASLVPAPTVFSDEYVYSKIALSLTQGDGFSVHGAPSGFYPPLYPLLLTPAFLTSNMDLSYFVIKLINVILSTLIIIPAYLLLKEFLTKKQAETGAILTAILPATFAFTPAIMAENVVYPLTLTTIYLLYKTYTQDNLKWAIAAGIAAGVTMLAKVSALIFIPTVILFTVIYGYKKQKKQLYTKSAIILSIFTLIYLPWMLRNFAHFGVSINNILGGYTYEATIILNQSLGVATTTLRVLRAANWFILYLGYTLLAGLIILPVYAIQWVIKNRHNELALLTILTTFCTISIGANHNIKAAIAQGIIGVGRPIGRYIDMILPLIICIGYIALHKEKTINLQKIKYSLIAITGYASILTLSPLFPINNLSLSWLGILAKVLPLAAIGALLAASMYLAIKYADAIPKKTVIALSTTLFLLTSLGAIAIIDYNATTSWTNQDHDLMGKYINENIQGTILLDNSFEGKITKNTQEPLYQTQGDGFVTLVGFWTTNKFVTKGQHDYLLTKEQKDLELIHQQGKFKLYAVEQQ